MTTYRTDSKEFCSNIVDNFSQTMWAVMIIIAGSDGPINIRERYLLNQLFESDLDVEGYDHMLAVCRNGNFKNIFGFLVDVSMQLSQQQSEELENYDPQDDPIIKIFGMLGDAVLSADESVSRLEAQCLSEFTAIAHSKAAELHRRIQSTLDVSETPVSAQTTVSHKPGSKAQTTPRPLEKCVAELHALVGLASVKREVETIINLARVFALRKEKGMPIPNFSFHMVFSGNPGTGKTTVARIVAKVYGSLGLLKSDNLVEVDRSGLVGSFVGQTANKIKKVIEGARGGVLFIDEAYSLVREANDYGHEAIEILLKAMEDYREDLVVIVAGYDRRMTVFLDSNPGLKSRFPRTIHFPDYSPAELVEMFERTSRQSGYLLAPGALPLLESVMNRQWQERTADFANGRDVRNIFERVLSTQANRIGMLATI